MFLLTLAYTIAAPSPDSLVGTWTGDGTGLFKNKYDIKLTLAADKTCVLEYSDREPPHTLNPYLKSNKIVVTGPWRVEENEAEDRIVIDATISDWIETVSPAGEKPSTSKIEPLPLGDGLFFAIQPDGTLKNALITFAGKSLLPGIPIKIQAIAVNLIKQDAQQP